MTKLASTRWLFYLCLMVYLTGCSKSQEAEVKKVVQVAPVAGDSAVVANSENINSGQGKNEPAGLLHTDEKGRKWIGDVPYDVFAVYFDEPLQVAANTQSSNIIVANNSVSASPGSGATTMQPVVENGKTAETKSMPEDTATPAGGSGWKQIISNEVLMSEVKRIRNEIGVKLKSVAEFNNSFAEIEILGGTLAAMAIIAYNHEEPPNWKDKALAIRDLAGAVAEGANGGRGRENFEKCQEPFEKIIVILDGSSPPDLKMPDNKEDWYATADTKQLMKRMEAAQAWLRLNVQNDKDFKAKVSGITTENSVMAALAQVIKHHDYAYADEEAYQNFVKDLLSANQSITKSLSEGNFELYQSATSGIEKACAACHLKYRFE